jgi:dipeptidyl aminopeptidase/acylaminoacyl peptidase
MIEKKIASYGTWKSPITANLIASSAIKVDSIVLDGQDTYWTEMRPEEGGRYVIVRRTPDGRVADINPPPFNARTRVHEYGGAQYTVADGIVYFANFKDQRLYRQEPGDEPEALTPGIAMRYADLMVDKRRNRLICVREDHTGQGEAVNTLVSIDLSRGDAGNILVSGNDFYASPRLSPDGTQLAWLTWNHPNMPWDGTELWLAKVKADGTLGQAELVAGTFNESIFQPEWSLEGELFFISDRSGWWNLYHRLGSGVEPICEMEAEFGWPQWVFGMSRYAFISSDKIACTYDQNGTTSMGIIDLLSRQLTPMELPFIEMGSLRAAGGKLTLFAASSDLFRSIVQISLPDRRVEVLRRSNELTIDEGYLSYPEAVEFPTEGGLTAHAFYYPPINKEYQGPADEKPPLIVFSHGGPTGMAVASLNLVKQFWTSRGFAIVDVNYGGSTGYGRAYRQRLNGQWGIVDVVDSINAVNYLVDQGLVDGRRLAIRGGSAGGYTTLCALTFHDLFTVGASYYGVSDLEALAKETHKFESRYLDSMVGPYPDRIDLYRERSPIHHIDQLSCAIIFFQGLEDKVVLPNQAEMMVEAISRKGLPVAYLPFAGEQHGFRRAENIIRTLEAELYFYGQIFGFEIADVVAPVKIENL